MRGQNVKESSQALGFDRSGFALKPRIGESLASWRESKFALAIQVGLTQCEINAQRIAMDPKYLPGLSFRLGPSGGTGGFYFDDDPREASEIAMIVVHFGDYIDGLQIGWADATVAHHGSCNGPSIGQFDISYQNGEKLCAIDGSIGANPGDGGPYVTSIRFHTETRSSQLFGKQSPDAFSYQLPDQFRDYSIVGFFGRACKYLDSIGPLVRIISASG
jgi:Jacalin-like lectin domain